MWLSIGLLTTWELPSPRAKIQRDVERLYPKKEPQLISSLVSAAAGPGLSAVNQSFQPTLKERGVQRANVRKRD